MCLPYFFSDVCPFDEDACLNRECLLTWWLSGEDPATGIVAGITTNPDGSALVTCVEDERLEFQVCFDMGDTSHDISALIATSQCGVLRVVQ